MSDQRSEPANRANYEIDYGRLPRTKAFRTVDERTIRATHATDRETVVDLDHSFDLEDTLEKLGIEFEVIVNHRVEATDELDRGFTQAAEKLAKELNGPAGVAVSDYYGSILVETASSLGFEKHRERRMLVERLYVSRGVPFTLECQRVMSDAVCKPLVVGMEPVLAEGAAESDEADGPTEPEAG